MEKMFAHGSIADAVAVADGGYSAGRLLEWMDGGPDQAEVVDLGGDASTTRNAEADGALDCTPWDPLV
jgi:hypothetical protein